MGPLKVFIGSSSEGKDAAERLSARLDDRGSVETKVWNHGVFEIGSHVLDDLIKQTLESDFAILVLSPDDDVESRNVQFQAPRDNVIFELGLFIGALGKNRTYMVQPDGVDLKLPSDVAGITQVRYNGARTDKDLGSALNPAAIKIHDQITIIGPRPRSAPQNQLSQSGSETDPNIDRDLQILERNLFSQGWGYQWNQAQTTLRVTSPRGHRRSLKLRPPAQMRSEFDHFIGELRGLGARVDSNLRHRIL